MRAVVVQEAGRLAVVEVAEPEPRDGELLVRVRAVSINRGEVVRARAAKAGFRPGWDFAGLVERSTRGGPAEGTLVAGYLHAGAWAERIAAPLALIAPVPAGVTAEAAASLPVAGLTALGALDAGGGLLGKRVLVTGATGGVGSFAANLAVLAGAEVTAVVRRPVEDCRRLLPGARILSLPGGLEGAEAGGPYDLIVETLGGDTLGAALGMLSSTGKCMTLGVTDTPKTGFDAERFFMTGAASLEGFVLFRNRRETASEGLTRLLRLVASGALAVEIGLAADFADIEAVAERLMGRGFLGKAVLRLGGGA
jgi:NADPH2:quinone reductase